MPYGAVWACAAGSRVKCCPFLPLTLFLAPIQFPDVVEFCEMMANAGKTIIVAALDGTFQRKVNHFFNTIAASGSSRNPEHPLLSRHRLSGAS